VFSFGGSELEAEIEGLVVKGRGQVYQILLFHSKLTQKVQLYRFFID
jgi:hypothetical protein